MNILRSFSDLVYPRTCELCGRPTDRLGRHICSACLMCLPIADPERTEEGVASALRFEGEARRMILDFKFNRHFWMRDDFTDFLEAAARARLDVAAVDGVVPVPTTLFHRIDRGYSPVDCLARELAKRLDRRYLPRALFRRGNPKRQSSLGEVERRENVKGTVGVRAPEWLRGRTLLVVDDILTTGSTLFECARQLKAAGAWRVWCATLARSVRD